MKADLQLAVAEVAGRPIREVDGGVVLGEMVECRPS